jgi:hypothetical protein
MYFVFFLVIISIKADQTGGEETKMKQILRIEGNANKVFNAIRNISQRHPYLTLEEAARRGLLEPRVQHTVPYELGNFPSVWLNEEFENKN